MWLIFQLNLRVCQFSTSAVFTLELDTCRLQTWVRTINTERSDLIWSDLEESRFLFESTAKLLDVYSICVITLQLKYNPKYSRSFEDWEVTASMCATILSSKFCRIPKITLDKACCFENSSSEEIKLSIAIKYWTFSFHRMVSLHHLLEWPVVETRFSHHPA